jgi:hypothetical protein
MLRLVLQEESFRLHLDPEKHRMLLFPNHGQQDHIEQLRKRVKE